MSKQIILGHSAISKDEITNRMAQTILFDKKTLNIKKVYCYLEKFIEDNISFDMHLAVYSCILMVHRYSF